MIAIYSFGFFDLSLKLVDPGAIVRYGIGEIEGFLQDTSKCKIAAIEFDYNNNNHTIDEVHRLHPHCDLIVVQSMELIPAQVQALYDMDMENVVFVLNGKIPNTQIQKALCIEEYTWLNSTAYLYQHAKPELIFDKLTPFQPKSYVFDVMYGRPRPHRQVVKQKILNSSVAHCFLQNDMVPVIEKEFSDKSIWWEDDISVDEDDYRKCWYHGQNLMLSQVIPFKVYNQSTASIVMETIYQDDLFFPTEKITKAFLSLRLFVFVGTQYFLKNLRDLGFQTFDHIIDESYDNISDDQQRWNAAMDQALWLAEQPQETWIKKAIPQLLHNYQHIMSLPCNKTNQIVEQTLCKKGYHRK